MTPDVICVPSPPAWPAAVATLAGAVPFSAALVAIRVGAIRWLRVRPRY